MLLLNSFSNECSMNHCKLQCIYVIAPLRTCAIISILAITVHGQSFMFFQLEASVLIKSYIKDDPANYYKPI